MLYQQCYQWCHLSKSLCLLYVLTPPCCFPKGLIIVQAFLLPELDSNTSFITWTRKISRGQPKFTCVLRHFKKIITLNRLIDAETDVTVISRSCWPLEWTLVPSLDILAGIGGHSTTFCSHCNWWLSCHHQAIHGGEENHLGEETFSLNRVLSLRQFFRVGHWWVELPKMNLDFKQTHMDRLWPLPWTKLVMLEELVKEQLDKGHIFPTTSPWNTLSFVIKKTTVINGVSFKILGK